MIAWVVGIAVALIIGGMVTNLINSIDNTKWPSWLKVVTKIIVWVGAVFLTIISACIFAVFAAGSSSSNDE